MNLLLDFAGDITERRTAYYALSNALDQKAEAIKSLQHFAGYRVAAGIELAEHTILTRLRNEYEALRKLRDALETAKEI